MSLMRFQKETITSPIFETFIKLICEPINGFYCKYGESLTVNPDDILYDFYLGNVVKFDVCGIYNKDECGKVNIAANNLEDSIIVSLYSIEVNVVTKNHHDKIADCLKEAKFLNNINYYDTGYYDD